MQDLLEPGLNFSETQIRCCIKEGDALAKILSKKWDRNGWRTR